MENSLKKIVAEMYISKSLLECFGCLISILLRITIHCTGMINTDANI